MAEVCLILKDGDYVPDGNGGQERAWGERAVLERVLFRLKARRGALPFLPELGSQLYKVMREKPSARLAAARQYVAQALEEEKLVRVTGVELEDDGERALLTVRLLWQGEELAAAMELERM